MGRRKKDPNQRYVNRGHTRWVERLRASLGLPAPWLPPRHGEHLRRLLELETEGLLTRKQLFEVLAEAFRLTWPRTWGAMAPRAGRGWATKELAALDAFPTFEERFEAVRTEENPKRFSSPELARRLLVRARAALPGDPEASETWARLALEVASRGETHDHRARQAHAWAFRANARRAQGRHAEAASWTRRVLALEREIFISDPRLRVDLDDLGASMARDHRDLDRAAALLQRVSAMARLLADDQMKAKALIGQSTVLLRSRDFAASLEISATALEHLRGPSRRYPLVAAGMANLLFSLCGLHRFKEAEQLLDKHTIRLDGLNQARLEWVRGTISRGLGKRLEAEQTFRGALEKMVELNGPWEVALIGLDLAALYLESGDQERFQTLQATLRATLTHTLRGHPESSIAYSGFLSCLRSLSAQELAKRQFLFALRDPKDIEAWPKQALIKDLLP